MAASGIAMFVNYPGGLEALQKKAGEGLEAVKQEILASCPESDKELMNYILNEPAGSRKQKYQNGWMWIAKKQWSSLTIHLPWREALS